MSRSNAAAALLFRRKGDGSTLNLDFTGGSLDSRITFSRGTNATYINSSGYVALNISNLFFNTAWTSITLPTGWGEGAATGTFTYNGNGTITMTVGTLQRAYLNPAYPYTPTQTGVPFTISFTVTAVSGSPTLGDVITTNSGTDTFTVNGVAKTSAEILFANDLITCTSTATGNAAVPRIGLGISGNVTGKSITLKNPQANIGSTAQTYIANASTTTAYYAPRFDYDPTTLAAKGLLIEGAATNLLNFSETFATTGGTNNNWADTNLTRTSTNNTSPRNDATALRITASAANGTIISSAAIGTSAERTLSVWLRRVTGTGNIQFTLDNGSTYTTQAITSAWIRYTFTATTASQRVGFRIVTSADAIEIWGAQLEIGTSASSYIQTVASQITRNADLALMTSTNFSSWFTGGTTGTFFVDFYGGVRGITSTVRSVISTSDQTTKHLHLQQASAAGVLKVADFGAANSVSTANTITSGARTKGAFNFDGATTTVNLCLNGSTVATSSAIAFTVAPTWLVLGATSTNGTSLTDTTTVLNGSIRQIKYYPTALTSAQLIAMTT